MKTRQFIVFIFLTATIIGCSSTVTPTATDPIDHITTDLSNYHTFSTSENNGQNFHEGFLGIVKVFVEHGVVDENKVSATYEADGTGEVFFIANRLFIVTAKHVIVPNHEIKSIGIDPKDPNKKIEFSIIKKVGSRVAVGSTGIEPIALWFFSDDKTDVSILEISDKDKDSLVYRPLDAQVDAMYLSNPKKILSPGQDVEVWGFPGKQSPQMQKVNINDINSQFLILNQAVLGGYSGGVILYKNNQSAKGIAGMVIRADVQSNQSTAISWDMINPLLETITTSPASVRKVTINESTNMDGVTYTYFDYYSFPYKTSIPRNSWELWKPLYSDETGGK